MVAETSESLVDYGREEQEQESKTEVTVDLEQEIFKILNLVLKFDLRDDPNGGTYILIYASYLKQRENDGIPLTQEEQISARRFSRSFPIMCVVSFLDKWSSVDFYVSLRSQLIDSVGESKLSSFKPQLVDRWILCSNFSSLFKNVSDKQWWSRYKIISGSYRFRIQSQIVMR